MPANPKYLTKSGWTRASKITAGILGGFAVSISIHLALASWLDRVNVLITMTFSGFILWAGLMIIAFLVKRAWKIWAIYLALVGICTLAVYLASFKSPII